MHRPRSKALLEPVDESCEIGCCTCTILSSKIGLHLNEWLSLEHIEPHGLITELRFGSATETVEPELQKARDVSRTPARRRKADLERSDVSTRLEQANGKPSRTNPVGCKPRNEIEKEPLRGLEEMRCARDGVEKASPDMIGGRRGERLEGLRSLPQSLIETQHEKSAKPLSEWCSRRLRNIHYAPQSEAVSKAERLGRKTQASERQRFECGLLCARGHDHALCSAEMGNGPRSPWRIGNCKTRSEAEVSETQSKIAKQASFATEEMCRARHLEIESVRSVGVVPSHDEGSIALAPKPEARERVPIRCKICIRNHEPFGFRACVGKQLTLREACSARRLVQGDETGPASTGRHENEGPRPIKLMKRSGESARRRCLFPQSAQMTCELPVLEPD